MTSYDDIFYQKFLDNLSNLKSLTKIENESDTRLRAIDTIIFDILQWEKKSVETEKYCRAQGYADYVFSLNDHPMFVLEAKRSGMDFVFKNRKFENRPYAFGLLAKECSAAMDALQQAIGYAATLGARYVGISNGHQWLFSLTFVPRQPLEKRLVYVFESLDAISNYFMKFLSCFSPKGIGRNEVSHDLLETLKLPAPAKLSSRIPGYPLSADRNVFQNELSYILDFLWQLIAQEEGSEGFVENCYVNPNSHEDILALVREVIEKRQNEDKILMEYELESIGKLPQELAHLPSERPFVVLGEVGRGKSSFLKYLRFVAVKEYLNNYLQIELNFVDRPDKATEIPNFVYSEIERQLREFYNIDINENKFVRGVLHSDLMRLKKTPKGVMYAENIEKYHKFELEEIDKQISDRHAYLTKVIHHLKRGRQCSVALFFDNLDRRSAKIQEEAFLRASAIARDWASLAFICLRPDTYYRSQRKGVLDSIAPIAFTVGQPDLALVLKRRFAFAKKIAEGQPINSKLKRSSPSQNISLDLPKVAKIFESCEFAAWKRHGIIPTLEAVSNGNIRRLLDLSRKILCCGHLDTKKIYHKILGSGHYYVPDYEGIKALLYGDYMHFDSNRSPFINLFDIKNADPIEHFLRISILQYLSKIPSEGATKGYIKLNDFIPYLAMLGYPFSISIESINILIEKHYLRKPVEEESELLETDKVRITSLGRYHLYNLVSVFQYLDAVLIDTPILDDNIRDSIKDEKNIHARVKRTELFINYLNSCSDNLIDKELQTLWANIYSEAIKNLNEVKKKN